jgi:hypothetical protein
VLMMPLQAGRLVFPISGSGIQTVFGAHPVSYSVGKGNLWAGIGQSVLRLATGRMVRGSNPGGDEIFRNRPDRLWGPPCTMVFPERKVAGAWR